MSKRELKLWRQALWLGVDHYNMGCDFIMFFELWHGELIDGDRE